MPRPRREEQPDGTRRIAQVLQAFNYRDEASKTNTFITPATSQDVVDAIPEDIMQQHVDTGFARWVNTPVATQE